MKEKAKLVNFITFLLFIAFTFSGCSKDENSKEKTKKSYTLQPRELAVLDNLIKDETSVFLDGGESLIFKDNLLAVTATDVAKEYEKNQVSADQKYFKQSLLVTGSISSINSGLGNEPYVVLRGINEFLSPQIHFNKNNVAKIAELKKGQKLSFVCNGAGAIIGTPMFNNCSFADDYAAIKVAEIRTKIQKFLSGESRKQGVRSCNNV
ncbi:MAG: hypothetical protein Q8L73_10665 [Methylotenera sp.]|nr:hypothetical protein [Methylotenera sp.]